MKAIKLLFAVLLLSLISAGSADAQTYEDNYTWDFTIYTWCDGFNDIISGPVTEHWMYHIGKGGKFAWSKSQIESSELVSEVTGERFEIAYVWKYNPSRISENIYEAANHYNLIGDRGSHYLVSIRYTYDLSGPEPVFTVLHESSKCW